MLHTSVAGFRIIKLYYYYYHHIGNNNYILIPRKKLQYKQSQHNTFRLLIIYCYIISRGKFEYTYNSYHTIE